jgi:putative solute:sodium symporter small subunit
MIEIALGILVELGVIAILMGAADTLRLPVGDLFPLLGFGGTGAIAGCGLMLMVHGAYRLLRQRQIGDQHRLRTLGLLWVGLLSVALLALGIPLAVEPLNIIKIGGFPLGFYMAAQGSLIALVILAFVVAWKQEAIDADQGVAEDQSLTAAAGT